MRRCLYYHLKTRRNEIAKCKKGGARYLTGTGPPRFQHPLRHLVTWYSNDQRTRNQIDYVLVLARWASSVLDCRAYRGADTGSANNSDRILLRATLRLRLKANRACQLPGRFDVSKLKTAAGAEFRIELRYRFEALSPDPDPNPEME